MKLFAPADMAKVDAIAKKANASLVVPKKSTKSRTLSADIEKLSKEVLEYFADSEAILITHINELHDYITNMIEAGIGGIDTETTGLDVLHDTIVGSSLYYPGGVECYIPNTHLLPIFDVPYNPQLNYEQVGAELQRLVDANTKLIFANADFDLSMTYKDYKVDLCPICHYDVILAWRCIKEDEKDNSLKGLYHKYVLKGEGDPKSFRDFFTPTLFPYCRPEVAKLYAAHDARITYELYIWQLPYVTLGHPKCTKHGFEALAKNVVWGLELPLIKECQAMHRRGIYLDALAAELLQKKYGPMMKESVSILINMVREIVEDTRYRTPARCPFKSVEQFNMDSPLHVSYLIYDLMKLGNGRTRSTGKAELEQFNLPITKQILYCRSLRVLISTFIEKLPTLVGLDQRVHCRFKSIGADTGRMSSIEPNMQNIPSKMKDIRHMFRATPGCVLLSSDYSQQEPRVTAFISNDAKMINTFNSGKDIYASIASIAFNVPYEQCLEMTPEGEYSPEGDSRRKEAKTVLLGICYGRSVVTIADQLYGEDPTLTSEGRIKKGQKVYDAVLLAFPALRALMVSAQNSARVRGYVESIIGRRRHIPDMQLQKFEVYAQPGYENPDIDSFDVESLENKEDMPQRIKDQIVHELSSLKYFGQVVKRTRELSEQHIKVINNTRKIAEASRKCVNSMVQGSAADMTKMAILLISLDPEWSRLGARLLVPVHDELIAEAPIANAEAAAARLAYLMEEAANFLPFGIKCDVTITYRWYGLEAFCKYNKPNASKNSLHELLEDEIKWIHYHLFEVGYPLVDKPDKTVKGDAAVGVTGVLTDRTQSFMEDYMKRFSIDDFSSFVNHIEYYVHYGELPNISERMITA